MARPAATHPRATSKDKLRGLLDDLAEKAVQTILGDREATPRAMADVLKVAGSYWAVSRKGEDTDKPPSAWEGYGAAMAAKGKDGNGAAH